MQENYNALKLDALRELAKSRDVKGYATMRKAELIAALTASEESSSAKTSKTSKTKTAKTSEKKEETKTVKSAKTSEKAEEPKSSKTSKASEKAPAKKTPAKKASSTKTVSAVKENVTEEASSEKETTASKKKSSSKKTSEEETDVTKDTAKAKKTTTKKATTGKTTRKKKGEAEEQTVSENPQEASAEAGSENAASEDAASQGEDTASQGEGASSETAAEGSTEAAAPASEERGQKPLPKPNVHGKLDIMASGYGFIRSINPDTGDKRDVYISNSFIRKYNLKTGDVITGNSHPTSRFDAIFYITAINGVSLSEIIAAKKAAYEAKKLAAAAAEEGRETLDADSEAGSGEAFEGRAARSAADQAEQATGTSTGASGTGTEGAATAVQASASEGSAAGSSASVSTTAGTATAGSAESAGTASASSRTSETSGDESQMRQEIPENRMSFEGLDAERDGFAVQDSESKVINIQTREVEGVYVIMPDGYGFLRCNNYVPGDQDIFVSPPTIRRFMLRDGDYIKGVAKINDRFDALIKIHSINDLEVDSEDQVRAFRNRITFENMTPIFPDQRIHLENPSDPTQIATRIIDLVSPIGKGQRGMIVSPPKAGKTTLLKQIARSIQANHPEIHLMVLLIDERPEEVTDIKESIGVQNSEVVYSTFDKDPENHCKISELVIDRARRLVESGRDVVILLDSITRLARAYNLVCEPSGRTLSGGLDPTALLMPKRFFGAARNMREGGSLTILATALVDTGSRMDDVVFEEFKGTGNMEIVLDRSLSERRIFPAIDILKSGTRREDLLLNNIEAAAMNVIRKSTNVARQEEAVEHILQMFSRTQTNRDFLVALNQMYKRGNL